MRSNGQAANIRAENDSLAKSKKDRKTTNQDNDPQPAVNPENDLDR